MKNTEKVKSGPFKAFTGFAGMIGLAFIIYTCSKEYNRRRG